MKDQRSKIKDRGRFTGKLGDWQLAFRFCYEIRTRSKMEATASRTGPSAQQVLPVSMRLRVGMTRVVGWLKVLLKGAVLWGCAFVVGLLFSWLWWDWV
jgi:hypothetical protein